LIINEVKTMDAPRLGVLPGRADRPARIGSRVAAGVFAGSLLWCLALVALAYHLAPTASGQAPFHVYWAGLLPVFGTSMLMLRRDLTPGVRVAVLSALGAVCALPKLLRTPGGPLFYDEMAHWGQVRRLAEDGVLFRPNIVPTVEDYPGLHVLTVAVSRMTGASAWTSGLVLVVACHVLMVLGVYLLATSLGLDAKAAGLAALVYACNPGFFGFTAMYAYESIAIVWQLWTLVACVNVVRASTGAERWRWAVLALGSGVAAAVTHHVSSIAGVVFVALVALAATLSKRVSRAGRSAAWGVFGALLAVNVGWMWPDRATLVPYLLNAPRAGLEQLSQLAGGTGGGEASSRTPFEESALPAYEQVASVLGVVLVTVLLLWAVWLVRGRVLRDRMWTALLVIALAVPVSMPLIVTRHGAPAAHRSWPFTYQALAVLVAVPLAWLVTSRRVVPVLAAFTATAVILVGGHATDFDAQARFPGPYASGCDGRVLTPEAIEVSRWLGDHTAPGTRFVASDFFTAGTVSAHSDAVYVGRFPTWELTFHDSPPRRQWHDELVRQGIAYLVVDQRITGAPFRGGYYIANHEPQAYVRTRAISPRALAKLDEVPWLRGVHENAYYTVYAVLPAGSPSTGPADTEEGRNRWQSDLV